ncbi:polysaccharide deacetylase family protein [Rhodobacteraceae bacterium KMM 6894]|nr:polysaccharide deacetylase family protein [Rhodobacteraceae bacterium KMM 6894]
MPAQEARYWISRDQYCDALDRAYTQIQKGRQIGITFDDGNRSDLEIAAPELVARGMTGQFFILTGRLDDPQYLSPADIQTLQGHGMAIGLHGHDHIDWRRLDAAGFKAETITARHTLAAITGHPITTAAIPFGAYNKKVIAGLARNGFRKIYTSDGGQTSDRRRVQHRSSVQADMSSVQIDAILTGQETIHCTARRAIKSWLKTYVIG